MPIRTVADVRAVLSDIGIKNTTLKWPKGKAAPLPYAVLVPHKAAGSKADGGVWFRCRRYDVELYFREFDMPLYKRVAKALEDIGIPDESDWHVDEENQYCVVYFPMTLIEQEASNGNG